MRYGPTGVLGLDFATTWRAAAGRLRLPVRLRPHAAALLRPGSKKGSTDARPRCAARAAASGWIRGGRDLVHNTHIRTSMSYLRRPGTGGVTQSESRGTRACAARSRGAVAARSRARIS